MNGEKLALKVAVMLQDQYLVQQLEDECYSGAPCLSKMQAAINDAVSELTTRFPVYMTAQFEAVGNVIPRSAIAGEGELNVTSVTANGKPVPYTVDHAGIHVDGADGSYDVTFAPEICNLEIDDNFDVAKEVGFMMTAYLVARNYCMMSGRMDEAAMYDSRYNDCAENIRLKRTARIRARKFI